MRKTALILSIVMLFSVFLNADIHHNAGKYGYQFLDISTNPISLSLAGRGISSSSQLSSFLRQPASSTIEAHRSIGASHIIWLADTSCDNLYYSWSNRKSHFGLAFRSLNYGELEIRDDNGMLIGHYSPLDIDLLGNYAMRLAPSLYAGVNVGIAYEKLDTDSSLGLHSDLGVAWLPPIAGTQCDLTIRNLGISSEMDEESTLFAPSLEMDLSKKINYQNTDITFELSGMKAVDENWKAAISSEIALFQRLLALRVGYKINYDAENLTAGLGLNWKNLSVDYGWASFSDHLNNVHSFGISYHF
ncbi:MAG: hypothetical protein BWY18_00628 [Candidatus Cloacimonetes bacterium ADurb.Bin211]|nr:MAG: hypothetical protein BWY18_00628 [Candidatus Cloacimonetes bacterium ADurb.Bin211]